MTFENRENDMKMLKVAGVGIALENSFESIKKIADDMCDSCEDDRIGYYLNRLMEVLE